MLSCGGKCGGCKLLWIFSLATINLGRFKTLGTTLKVKKNKNILPQWLSEQGGHGHLLQSANLFKSFSVWKSFKKKILEHLNKSDLDITWPSMFQTTLLLRKITMNQTRWTSTMWTFCSERRNKLICHPTKKLVTMFTYLPNLFQLEWKTHLTNLRLPLTPVEGHLNFTSLHKYN